MNKKINIKRLYALSAGCVLLMSGCTELIPGYGRIPNQEVEQREEEGNNSREMMKVLSAKIKERASYYSQGSETPQDIGNAVVVDCHNEINNVVGAEMEEYRRKLNSPYQLSFAGDYENHIREEAEEAAWKAAVRHVVKYRTDAEIQRKSP